MRPDRGPRHPNLQPVSRRGVLRAAAAGFGGLALGGLTGCADSGGGGGTTEGGVFTAQAAITHLTALVHAAPLHIAKQLGYYEDEQLDIEHVSFSGGSETIRGMDGDIGLGMPASLALLIAYEKGRDDLRIIGSTFNAASVDFIVPADSPVKSVEDLKGKKVGVSRPGSNSTYFATRTLKEAGYTPGEDVQIVAVGGASDSWTAATQGVVDVAWSASPLMDGLVVGGEARIVWRSRDFVTDWTDTCLAVRSGMLEANGDAVGRWVKAIARGMDLINNDPDAAAEAYATAVDLEVEAAKAALTEWPEGTWDIQINQAGLQANSDAGIEQGKMKQDAPLDEIVVTDYVEAV